MDPAADEEPTEFLEPVEDEIVQNIDEPVNDEEMLQVEHEEVLEEIVDGGEVMYDEEGRLIEYVYEDGTEVIEEFVEVEDDANGEYAFVVLDEHGQRRLVKHSDLEIKKTMPDLMGDVDEGDGEGPSSSNMYAQQKQDRIHGGSKAPATMRDLLKGGMGRTMYDGYYSGNRNKRIHNLAKIDVEKYVPAVTINRRPLPDNPDFTSTKKPRSRKNPPWQEDVAPNGGPSTSRRSPSPAMKDPLFPEDEEMVVRFKCPECGDGFPTMASHCDHMCKIHDCQSVVREVEFFQDRDFDAFFMKMEKSSMLREGISGQVRKKSRAGVSQTFVCNYMKKERTKHAEFAEVGLSALAERPEEFCTAFVQKIHSYPPHFSECIRVSYCDQHIHHDGNLGFRVPIAVKRRMFEMAFKRLPIPCMQLLLGIEAEALLPHPTRFEQKLKNFSHLEIVELMGIINASLKKYPELENPIQIARKVAIKFDTYPMPDGRNTLVVRRVNPPRHTKKPRGLEDEEEEEELEQDDEEMVDGADGLYEESMLYDPENNKDPLLEELTENELTILEAYERDICIQLSDDQKRNRLRERTKFSLEKVVQLYNSLDTTSHTIAPTEMHNDSINNLREMASFVVEIVCQLDAEVKAQFNPSLRVDEIKRDMIAGIAMQERSCQPEGRRRRSGAPQDPNGVPKYSARRAHEEYPNGMYDPPPPHRDVRIASGAYDMSAEERHIQMLRKMRMQHPNAEEVEQKHSVMAPAMSQPEIPEELKGTAYSKPQRRRPAGDGPPRKRVRKEKAKEPEVATSSSMSSAPETEQVPSETLVEAEESPPVEENVPEATEVVTVAASSAPSPVPEPSTAPVENLKVQAESPVKKNENPDPEVTTPAPATKTRTGRVVKPKRWIDE